MDVAWKPSRRKQRRAAARICSRRASRCCWLTFGMLSLYTKRTFVLTFFWPPAKTGGIRERSFFIRGSQLRLWRSGYEEPAGGASALAPADDHRDLAPADDRAGR